MLQVRSLKLTITATITDSNLAKRIFKKQRQTLTALNLRVQFTSNKSDASRILAEVDALGSLESLSLGRDGYGYRNSKELHYAFEKLQTLTTLSLGKGIHIDTVRTLMDCSRLSLREVHLGDNDFMEVLSSTATAVEAVFVSGNGISASIVHLQKLPQLRKLYATPSSKEQSEYLLQLLKTSSVVPWTVDLTLPYFGFLTHWNEPEGMERVSTIVVKGGSMFGSGQRLPPLALPYVKVLELHLGCNNALFTKVKAAWSVATAPMLRKLSLLHMSSCVYRDWVADLRAQRPDLEVTITTH